MRYKKHTRAEIDKAIHDAGIANLSQSKTIEYVLKETGVTISHTQLIDRRRFLRQKGIGIWNGFRKDDYAYRLEHLERLKEARIVKEHAAEKEMEYYKNPKTFFQWKAAAYTLLDASKYLHELDKLIPEIDVISSNATEMDEGISQVQSEEQGPLSTQKGRVF